MELKRSTFDEQSIQQILRLAMEKQAEDSSALAGSRLISAEELEAMAAELGVTPSHLLAAREQWQRGHMEKTEAKQARKAQCRALRLHALTFLAVNSSVPLLYWSDFYGSHSNAVLVPFLWTIGLIGHAGVVWRGRQAASQSGSLPSTSGSPMAR